MLKEWPGCFDNLFPLRRVSYSCHLQVCRFRFFLCSIYVLAALPHLQKVVDLGHSVQFAFFRCFLYYQVVLCVCRLQCWVIACQDPDIGSSKPPYSDFFVKSLTCAFWPPPADNISRGVKLASTATPWGMKKKMLHTTLERLAYFECVSSCWGHQSVMSGTQNVLQISIGSEW